MKRISFLIACLFVVGGFVALSDLNYPVDAGTDRFSIAVDGTTAARGQRWPRRDGQPIKNLDPSVVYMLEVYQQAPVTTPGTNKLDGGTWTDDLQNQTATLQYQLIPLTPEERQRWESDERRRENRNEFRDERDDMKAALLAIRGGQRWSEFTDAQRTKTMRALLSFTLGIDPGEYETNQTGQVTTRARTR